MEKEINVSRETFILERKKHEYLRKKGTEQLAYNAYVG